MLLVLFFIGQITAMMVQRALVTRPVLILADEPTGELDSATGQQIMELFREIVDREKTTVLIATHNLTVDMFADRVCLLEDGQIRSFISQAPSSAAQS
jgi:putative ABC transport system ATP-binding protein